MRKHLSLSTQPYAWVFLRGIALVLYIIRQPQQAEKQCSRETTYCRPFQSSRGRCSDKLKSTASIWMPEFTSHKDYASHVFFLSCTCECLTLPAAWQCVCFSSSSAPMTKSLNCWNIHVHAFSVSLNHVIHIPAIGSGAGGRMGLVKACCAFAVSECVWSAIYTSRHTSVGVWTNRICSHRAWLAPLNTSFICRWVPQLWTTVQEEITRKFSFQYHSAPISFQINHCLFYPLTCLSIIYGNIVSFSKQRKSLRR